MLLQRKVAAFTTKSGCFNLLATKKHTKTHCTIPLFPVPAVPFLSVSHFQTVIFRNQNVSKNAIFATI